MAENNETKKAAPPSLGMRGVAGGENRFDEAAYRRLMAMGRSRNGLMESEESFAFHTAAGLCCGSGKGGLALNAYSKHRGDYSRYSLQDNFATARTVVDCNWYASWVTEVRKDLVSAGFRFQGTQERRWAREIFGVRSDWYFDFEQLVEDIWIEYLTCENAVAFWHVNDGEDESRLPAISILNCEQLYYDNAFGKEVLVLKFSSNKGLFKSSEQNAETVEHGKTEADDLMRYAQLHSHDVTLMRAADGSVKMKTKGKELIDTPFDFAVLSTAKTGQGLRKPRICTIFDDLDFIELLKIGDWNGGWFHKDHTRMAKMGHDISTGQFAGFPNHFPTAQKLDGVKKKLSEQNGNRSAATRFDTELDYFSFDPEFFNSDKYKGAMERVLNWGGPPALLLQDGFSVRNGVSPYLTQALRGMVRRDRKNVGRFLARILNKESFLGAWWAEDIELIPEWDKSSEYTHEELLSYVKTARDYGLMSAETGRDMLDLDDEHEGDLLEEEHKNRLRQTPSFEPRQGLSGSNVAGSPTIEGDGGEGRPPENIL